jgi:hypothetical protein
VLIELDFIHWLVQNRGRVGIRGLRGSPTPQKLRRRVGANNDAGRTGGPERPEARAGITGPARTAAKWETGRLRLELEPAEFDRPAAGYIEY